MIKKLIKILFLNIHPLIYPPKSSAKKTPSFKFVQCLTYRKQALNDVLFDFHRNTKVEGCSARLTRCVPKNCCVGELEYRVKKVRIWKKKPAGNVEAVLLFFSNFVYLRVFFQCLKINTKYVICFSK